MYRYNFLLAIGWIIILVASSPEQMHEWALAGIAVAAVLSLTGLLRARSDEHQKPDDVDKIVVFATAVLATGIYWYRAWNGLPSQMTLESFFRLLTGFGFWWPGVLYASLFRYPDDDLKPKDRSRFNQTVIIGFAGSLIGLIAALILLKLL